MNKKKNNTTVIGFQTCYFLHSMLLLSFLRNQTDTRWNESKLQKRVTKKTHEFTFEALFENDFWEWRVKEEEEEYC